MNNLINIEIAFASTTQQTILPLQVKLGTTILEAINQSGILSLHAEINLDPSAQSFNSVGIFGQLKDLNVRVEQDDRIEIYRQLPQSAMEQRKKKAVKIKKLQMLKDHK